MTSSRSVRWARPPIGFELHSIDDHVLAHAALVFKPWISHASPPPDCVWRVEPVDTGAAPAWRLAGCADRASHTHTSIASAIRSLETMAVRTCFDSPSARTLHGALVSRNGRGVILVGRGEAGKSTLACALWERGWSLLGDDIALVDEEEGCAWAAPCRVSLREASRELLGAGLWSRLLATPAAERTSKGWLFNPAEIDGRDRSAPVRLGALVFLGRTAGLAPGPRRLVPAQALLALLPYSNLSTRMAAGDVIRRLRPLAELVPAWDLAQGPITEMIAAVETTLEGSG